MAQSGGLPSPTNCIMLLAAPVNEATEMNNQRVYRAAFRNPIDMQTGQRYEELKQYILRPILAWFEIPKAHQPFQFLLETSEHLSFIYV